LIADAHDASVYRSSSAVAIDRIGRGAADIRSCHPVTGPELVPRAGAAVDGAQGQHGVGTRRAPAHADALRSSWVVRHAAALSVPSPYRTRATALMWSSA